MTVARCAYGALASPRQALHAKWAASPAASFRNSRGSVRPVALAALTLNATPRETGRQLYSTFMTSVLPSFKKNIYDGIFTFLSIVPHINETRAVLHFSN